MTQLEALNRLAHEPSEADALLRLLAAYPLTKPEKALLVSVREAGGGVRSLVLAAGAEVALRTVRIRLLPHLLAT